MREVDEKQEISLLWPYFDEHLHFEIAYLNCISHSTSNWISLPARASEQGNVIGSVRIYIYIFITYLPRSLYIFQ